MFIYVCPSNSLADFLILTVSEIHEDLMKAKIESRKERLPPRAPKDKPNVTELKDDELQ
jgi:hypothetical protein